MQAAEEGGRGPGLGSKQAGELPTCPACLRGPAAHVAPGVDEASVNGGRDGPERNGQPETGARSRPDPGSKPRSRPRPGGFCEGGAFPVAGRAGDPVGLELHVLSEWGAPPSRGQLLPGRNVGSASPDLLTFREKRLTLGLNTLLFKWWQRNPIRMSLGFF